MKALTTPMLAAAICLAPLPTAAAAAQQDAVKNVQPSPAPAEVAAGSEASRGTAAPATVTRAMSNDDVLALVNAGVPSAAIVAKIKAAPGGFDTSPGAFAQMRALGVPDAVLRAMGGGTDGGTQSGEQASGETPPRLPLKDVKIPAGVRVELEMAYTIDSQRTRKGDAISLRVVNPVIVDGAVVVAAGAVATAVVTKAERNGHFGRAGRLRWELKEVTAVDGSRVPLAAAGRAVGDSRGAKVATMMAFGVLSPFMLGAGFKRGENAIVPEGKRYEAVVQSESVVSAAPRR